MSTNANPAPSPTVPIAVAIAALAFCAPSFAQEGGADDRADLTLEPAAPGAPLVTDRPDFTESAVTVAPGRVQIETGFTYEDGDDEESFTAPEALVRVGLAERWELRLEAPSFAWGDFAGDDETGLTDMSLGFKHRLTDQDGALPELAVIGFVGIPTGDDAFTTDSVDPGAILAAGWDLGDGWAIGANAGIVSTEDGTDDRFTETSASVALAIPISDKVGGYVEYFGLYRADGGVGPEHNANGGLTYLINPNLQLDALVGAGLNDRAPDFFVGAGLSVRY